MKNFDPIDIIFITIISFYLVALIIFIVILISLLKKYDEDGNRIKNDDKILKEMNSISNTILETIKNNKYKKID